MKKIIPFLVISIVLGTAFIAISTYFSLYPYLSFKIKGVATVGTVVDMEHRITSDSSVWYPVVSFVTDTGQKITIRSQSGDNPPAFSTGDTTPVYYIAQDPYTNYIYTPSNNTIFIIIFGIGVFLLLLGIIPLLLSIRRKRLNAKLLSSGMKIQATYQSVKIDTTLSINDESPYRIICQWQNPKTKKIHLFYSEHIWFDPEEYIDRDKIYVYLQPDNFKNYVMDVSFLPEPPSYFMV